jgi:hypothetical protein
VGRKHLFFEIIDLVASRAFDSHFYAVLLRRFEVSEKKLLRYSFSIPESAALHGGELHGASQ